MTALVLPGRRGSQPLRPLALIGGAFGGVAIGLTAFSGLGGQQTGLAIAFAALIFVGELARVALPGDREIAPVAIAGGLGYALTFAQGDTMLRPAPLTVAAVTAVACAAGALVHGAAGRQMGLGAIAHRVMVVAATTALFQALMPTIRPEQTKDERVILLMCIVVAISGGMATLLTAIEHSARHRTPLLAALGDEIRAVAGIGAAIGATGVLIALSSPLMRLWALPALSIPLLVAQFSLRRYSSIRATYRQTIRALSKVTEVGGYVAPGHSRRVAALAVATGREVGMTESDLLDLEYAALMHDIGQLSLAEPIPGGSTLTVPPVERRRIAELGAEVIRSSQALDHVALIVERQADPYRRNRRPADPTLPLESRIIKAASAYDDIVAASPDDPRVRADALERLRLGMAYEYDPRVVEALARVVARIPFGASPTLSA